LAREKESGQLYTVKRVYMMTGKEKISLALLKRGFFQFFFLLHHFSHGKKKQQTQLQYLKRCFNYEPNFTREYYSIPGDSRWEKKKVRFQILSLF
jgi:hypothetical protein